MQCIAAIGTPLSGNTVRLQAITNVEAYVPPAISFDPGEEPGEIFGSNVFTKAEMQARLPKSVYKSVAATIDKGVKLSIDLASKSAEAAKELAENVKEYIDMGKGVLAIAAGQEPKAAPLVDAINSVKITTEGNTVSVKGEVGEELIEKALKDK